MQQAPIATGYRNLAKTLDIQLVANTHTGRHDLHVIEALGAPFEKGEALRIALGLSSAAFSRAAREHETTSAATE